MKTSALTHQHDASFLTDIRDVESVACKAQAGESASSLRASVVASLNPGSRFVTCCVETHHLQCIADFSCVALLLVVVHVDCGGTCCLEQMYRK